MAWSLTSVSDWELSPGPRFGRVRFGGDAPHSEPGRDKAMDAMADRYADDANLQVLGGWFPPPAGTLAGSMTLHVFDRPTGADASAREYLALAGRGASATGGVAEVSDLHLGLAVREWNASSEPGNAAYVERWTIFPREVAQTVLLTVQTPFAGATEAVEVSANLFARSLAWAR